MLSIVLLLFFYLFTPLLILHCCHRFPWVNKLGSVVVAYILGIVVGNLGILPENSKIVQEWVSNLSIPIALPLLLFSLNIRSWFKIAGKALLSLLLGEIALVLVLVLGFHFWHDKIDEPWKVAGMLAGVYTGGTMNMAAIAAALHVKSEAYLVTNTYDILISSVYMFFLMTVAQRFFTLFLPKFKHTEQPATKEDFTNGNDPYWGMLRKEKYIPLLGTFGLSLLIAFIGLAMTLIFPSGISTVIAILAITSLGIIASLIPRINRVGQTFELGMYFILIFSLVVASMANLQQMVSSSIYLLYYVCFAIFGTLFLHAFLAWIFKVDADTVIITSTATINSPPFVPLVASALHNKEVIMSGLTVGIIGYAIGNYVGVFLAYALR
jgi:uncharacterized membrane protein